MSNDFDFMILVCGQVTVKHLKGGKETKMDLMVMENLFFKRNISRVYDLKGSARSRYNSDTTGTNKVLLDMNLLESLRTKPIFLGSKAKRSLERSIWNDTSFLAVCLLYLLHLTDSCHRCIEISKIVFKGFTASPLLWMDIAISCDQNILLKLLLSILVVNNFLG